MNKKESIIAVDIDGCLTGNNYECKLYSSYFKKEIKPKDLIGFTLTECLGISVEQENRFWEENIKDYHQNADLDKTSIKNIIEITKNYDRVVLLTARCDEFKEDTLKWLEQVKEIGLNFNDLILTSDKDKIPYLESLKANALIEDNGDLTTKLKFSHPQIKTYLVDRKYNKMHYSRERIESNYNLTEREV